MNEEYIGILIRILEGVFTSEGLFGIIAIMSLFAIILALVVMIRILNNFKKIGWIVDGFIVHNHN